MKNAFKGKPLKAERKINFIVTNDKIENEKMIQEIMKEIVYQILKENLNGKN